MSSEKNLEEIFYKIKSGGLVDMRILELLGKYRGYTPIQSNKEMWLKIYRDHKNRKI